MFMGVSPMGTYARTILEVYPSAIIERNAAKKVQARISSRGVPGNALAEQGK
jgi:hypothetical protein